MPLLFLASLLLLPLVEITVLVLLGSTIGFWPTLALVIGAGALGFVLLRRQGSDTVRRLQRTVARREMPSAEMFDGLCLAVAAVLLILPGLLTDLVALILLVPPVRRWLLARLIRRGGGSGGTVVVEGTWTEIRRPDARLPHR